MCFKEVIENMKTLYDLDELPAFVYVKDIVGISGNSYDIEQVLKNMMSNNVVWH